jgi:hypothetical protein
MEMVRRAGLRRIECKNEVTRSRDVERRMQE